MACRIVPVILSGGTGSRLWPMSRELHPKQLLSLCSERSMLQETVGRVNNSACFSAPLVVCNQEHRFIIAEQLREAGIKDAKIILEPMGRNTAPACAVAALQVAAEDPDALLLVMPADHQIRDRQSFAAAVETAAAAADGRLVTFGIVPSAPETGYGYIRCGDPLDSVPGAFQIASFVEKPPRPVAERFLAEGGYTWNSGMFLFPVSLLLAELERFAPEVLEASRRAVERSTVDLDFRRLDQEAFAKAPSISIDCAVMEHTTNAAVIPCDLGWTDVGAWSALWEIGTKDADGNVLVGDIVTEQTANSYAHTDGPLTALVGVDGVVVVVTGDAVLVADRNKVQDVKAVVDRLKAAGREEIRSHSKVYRPWGSYQGLHHGERFQVKCLTVQPGRRLSLQKHYHRAEHWVVVKGTALVTRDQEQVMVYENQSIYLPIGTVHRLENPGKVPLEIIEVQSGSYLGEDDIVRIDDAYGRTT